jgi:hypothetical protein
MRWLPVSPVPGSLSEKQEHLDLHNHSPMNKKIFYALGIVSLLSLSAWFVTRPGAAQQTNLRAGVKKGLFEMTVTATGELKAKNSVEISGPTAMREVQVYQVKLSNLVPEGTVVKKGDYVASLDKTELMNKLKDAEAELQKFQAQFTQAQLDSSLNLRAARDEMVNLGYEVKEKNIVLEQSKYEPPATIRQAEIDLEKIRRKQEQSAQNLKIKRNQAIAKMSEVGAQLSQAQSKVDRLRQVVGQFEITAPEPGMVIYHRDWSGKKVIVGSTVNAWDPTVATLPDLSTMISKTFVNEVDIRKIKQGQTVKVGLDAFPEKKLTGKVVSVANVGETMPNSDAKVFEVNILVNESDTTLRPAMTTSNLILTGSVKEALYIPLEAVHSQGDSLTYVFKADGGGFVRQQVKLGQTNENEVVVLEGLRETEEVYLSMPKDGDRRELVLLPKPKGAAPATKPSPNLSAR